MKSAVIIADDLTGACDSGVQMLHKGHAVRVLIDVTACKGLETNQECITAVNTDTRSINSAMAYQKVRETASVLRENGFDWFYKKVDSLLRGNTGREIEAMLDELHYDAAVIVPAFPACGRRVINGYVHVADSGDGVSFSGITAIRQTSEGPCGSIGLPIIRSGNSEEFENAIDKLLEGGTRLLLIDSETDEDIHRAADMLLHARRRILPAGSAGLVSQMGDLMESESRGLSMTEVPAVRFEGQAPKVILVVGTRHPATMVQLQKLFAQRETAVAAIDMNSLVSKGVVKTVDTAIKRFDEGYKSQRYIVITTDRIASGIQEEFEMKADLFNSHITDALADLAKRMLERFPNSAMILTGGATASVAFQRIGAYQITLMAEPLSGVVAGMTESGLHVATKSGGFGNEDTLLLLSEYMIKLLSEEAP